MTFYIIHLQQALTENKVCGRMNGDQLHGQKMGRGIPWWLIQWLGLHAFTAKGMGSILCLGTKIPHGVAKKKKVGFSRKCARKWGFWPRWCSCPCLCSQRPALCQSPYHSVFIIMDYFLIHLFYWNCGIEFLEHIRCPLLSFVVPASRTTPMFSVDRVNGGMNGHNTNVNKCRVYRML